MLDRLATIMRTKRIDNEGEQNLRHRKSLVNTARKHQLQRITQENKRLLQRIQQVNPIIDHVEFDIRAKKNEYMKRQLSDFKEVPLPSQVETWLSEKNKLLQASKRDVDGDESPYRREVYTGGAAATGTLRRSQSARTPSWTQRHSVNVEDDNDILRSEEDDEGHNADKKAAPIKTRRRRRSKQSGRKKIASNNSSPLRGRIRPKSGRI
mmetsp:Transcript_16979/g.28332  ORF Transcript_16979/g.28332 Transcript_16979/m.28332 type:complete len:209 (+) Transcript_16979:408-1034(+)